MCVHTIWEASSIEHRETVRANLTRLVPPHRTPCVVRASCAVLARGIYARRSAAGSQTHLTQNLTHAFSCKFAFNAHKPHIAYLHRRGRPKRQEGLRERGCNRSIGYTPLVTFSLLPPHDTHTSAHTAHTRTCATNMLVAATDGASVSAAARHDPPPPSKLPAAPGLSPWPGLAARAASPHQRACRLRPRRSGGCPGPARR